MTIDDALLGLGTGSQIALLLVLFARKIFKGLPILAGYMIYLIISDPALYVSYHFLSDGAVERLYLLTTIADFSFQTGIILEIGAAIVAPMKPHVPRMVTAFIYATLLCSLLIAAWVSTHENFSGYDPSDRGMLKWSLGFAVFRVLALLVLFLTTRFLGVGWRWQAARVAIGISFYAAVSLLVNVAHELGRITGGRSQTTFADWERVGVAGWAGALMYLTFYLSHKRDSSFQVVAASSNATSSRRARGN